MSTNDIGTKINIIRGTTHIFGEKTPHFSRTFIHGAMITAAHPVRAYLKSFGLPSEVHSQKFHAPLLTNCGSLCRFATATSLPHRFEISNDSIIAHAFLFVKEFLAFLSPCPRLHCRAGLAPAVASILEGGGPL